MSKISSYILQLVIDNGYAIIPGIGGFVANQGTPSIDKASGHIGCPTVDVTFSREMRLNDGLLIQKFMVCDEMSYPAAKRVVEAASSQMSERLNEGANVVIEGIGVLSMDMRGDIRFTAERQLPNMSAWGLGALDMPLLVNLKKAAETAETQDTDVRHHTPHRLTVWNYMQYAAACIIALIIYFSFSEPIDNYSVRRYDNYASIVPTSAIMDMTGTHDEVKVISTSSDDETHIPEPQPVKAKEPAVTAATKHGIDNNGRYCIIVASLPGGTDPQQTIDSFVAKGFKGTFAVRGEGRTRICIAAYDTMSEAVNMLRQVVENSACTDAWILTRQAE